MMRARLLLLVLCLAACQPTSPSPTAPSAVDTPAPASTASGGPASTQSAVPAPAAGWEQRSEAPFARLEMAVAVHDGAIWLAGGLDAFGAALPDVAIYDPAADSWSEGPDLPVSLHHAALVSTGDDLLVMGGYLGSSFGSPTDGVLRLTDAGDAWEAGPALPAARAAGAAAWDGGRVLYGGGVGDGVEAEIFALEGGDWRLVGDLQRNREHLAAASDGEGRTWFLGGRQGSLESNLALVDLVEGDDVTAAGELPTPRGGVAAFWAPEIGACLTGGEAPTQAFDAVECIDADGAVTTLPVMSARRHGHGAVVVDGVAFAVLGGPSPGLAVSSSIEALDLEALP
jgi:hypothetical protein